MSIRPGALKVKAVAAEKAAAFNWNAFLEDGAQITGVPLVTVTGNDSVLTVDSVTVVNAGRQVNYRLLGGTLGGVYTVTCQITTDENPEQKDERSFRVLIQGL